MVVLSAPALPPSDPAPGRSPVDGYADGSETKADRTRDLRADLVQALTAAFEPINEYRRPDPADEDARTLQTDDARGLTVARPLTFGEIADAVLAAGWRRVTEDPRATLDQMSRLIDAVAGIVMDSPEDRQRHHAMLLTFRRYERKARAAMSGYAVGPQYRARVYKGAPCEVRTLADPEPVYVDTGWHYVIYDQHLPHGMQILLRSAWASHADALSRCLTDLAGFYGRSS